MIGSVTAPRCWLMREPSRSAAQETELLFGHTFRIDKVKKSWVFGQALSPLGSDANGYVGWMKRKYLIEDYAPRTHFISAMKAPIFNKSDIKSRITRLLPLGAQINASRIGEKFCELASGGFVHRRHLSPLGDYPESDFVKIAQDHMGLPYIWGGISTDGLDCSGLVQSSLRGTGRDCARDAGQQEESLGQALSGAEALRRGDLVFWPGHVGIMSDSKTLLHANAFHMKVALEPLEAACARIGPPRSLRRL